MEAIVLAGGLGTRLREIVPDRPKVLADVGGQPFLSCVLAWLYRCGVTHVVVAAGYMADSIKTEYGSKFLGLLLDYSVEEAPLGTGGAIKKALSICHETNVIVVNGDTFFDVQLDEMLSFHVSSGAMLTVALKYMTDLERYSTVEICENKIVSFHEKQPAKSGRINGGVYVINKELLSGVREERFSFEKTVLEQPTFEKRAFLSDGYFIDIGVPEDYEKACRELKTAVTPRKRRVLLLDRDGTLNMDTVHLYKPEDFVFINDMPALIERYRSDGYLCAVITNQAGIAKGLYSEADVNALHSYINRLLAEKYLTCIDAFFYCPHHPNGTMSRYARSCDCRKPEPGLILQAVEYFRTLGIEIDLKNSVLIGDKLSDIEAGKTAGVGTTILI